MEDTLPFNSAPPKLSSIPAVRVIYSGEDGEISEPSRLFGKNTFYLGRKIDSHKGLSFNSDPHLSRVHASISVRKKGRKAVLKDEGSRNGTHLNGARIKKAPLADGDVIRIGDTLLVFRREPVNLKDCDIDSLIGVSPKMREVRQAVGLFAPTDTTILLVGQTGTGKEVTSLAVHEMSGRKGPFVAVNCAAIPESLAESQLFGHRAGAFTGADSDHAGFFRSAHGGTLFLDEIGELSSTIQPKLLRALEDHSVIPVGAAMTVDIDVRVIVASSTDLEQAVEKKRFRKALYARLAEIAIVLPPLSQRREDVLLLARHHLGNQRQQLSADLVEALLIHHWPFNVRELVKLTKELQIRGKDETWLDVPLIGHRLKATRRDDSAGPSSKEEEFSDEHDTTLAYSEPVPTKDELEVLLKETGGNISSVARTTGRSRRQVYRWVEKYDLDPSSFRD